MPARPGSIERVSTRKGDAMTSLDHVLGGDAPSRAGDSAPESLWQRFLRRFIEAPREANLATAALEAREGRANLSVFRITRVELDRWVVVLPGRSSGHEFADPESAEAFVRSECGDASAMVELYIDELYVSARLEPNRPPLFRASESK
jgi:hypothetical protein